MLTRCPHCATIFRVTPEHLKVRAGQVRCGACRGAFNALDSLADEVAVVIETERITAAEPRQIEEMPLAETIAEPEIAEIAETPNIDIQPEPPPILAEPTPIAVEAPPEIHVEPESQPEIDLLVEPLSEPPNESPNEPPDEPPLAIPQPVAEETGPEPDAETTAGAEDTSPLAVIEIPAVADVPAAESELQHDEAVTPAETEAGAQILASSIQEEQVEIPAAWCEIPAPKPPLRWPWVTGVAALLLLTLGQLLYIYRVELSILLPDMRPALVAGCELLECSLPLPHKPELLSIEASDLIPADNDRLLLTATLKNRAPFNQELPNLELTLTDTRDAAMVRKVLTPADYLPADQETATGFPARSEIAVRLPLEALGVPAVGYRLYLFYP